MKHIIISSLFIWLIIANGCEKVTGPTFNDHWTHVNSGLRNQLVKCLAIKDTNLLAGTTDGVFLSTNNGDSWNDIGNGLPSTFNCSLTFIGANIFIGTDSGVFISTNHGSSWKAINFGLTNTHITALAANSTDLFAGTYGNGVYRSVNYGTTWIEAKTGLASSTSQIYTIAINGSDIFAGTNYGAFISTNNGTSWASIDSGLIGYHYINSFAFNESYIYAALIFNGVYRSSNHGVSWESANNGLDLFTLTQGAYAIIEANSKLFVAANVATNADSPVNNIFFSTDNGSSWAPFGGTGANPSVLVANDKYLFGASFGGGVVRIPLP
jgi:photosystem II stability/assembly factor-like uncharacterized protein